MEKQNFVSSEKIELSKDKVTRLGMALPRGSRRRICEVTGMSPFKVKKNFNRRLEFDKSVIDAAISIYNENSINGQISITDLQ